MPRPTYFPPPNESASGDLHSSRLQPCNSCGIDRKGTPGSLALVSVTQLVCLFHTPIRKFSYASYSSDLPFTRDITAQALAYVEAIDLSVVAAQLGFTVAEEAILLDNATSSTLDERNSYIEGMLNLAQQGHDIAAETLQTFRDVRKNVLAVGHLFLCCHLVFTCSG